MSEKILRVFLFFTLEGVTLKLSDFFGEKKGGFSAYIFAFISALILGFLISEDGYSSAIIIGVMLGAVLSGKVNRSNLIFGLTITIFFATILGIKRPSLWLLVGTSIFSFIDEIGHDRATKNRFLSYFFRYRLTLKLFIVILTILSILPVIYCICFFCFDISYDSTSMVLGDS